MIKVLFDLVLKLPFYKLLVLGIVILMVDEKVPPAVGRNMVKGLPDPINSAFHLTYNMVLNLLRVEEINPEYMLERSFFQFQNQAAIPGYYEGNILYFYPIFLPYNFLNFKQVSGGKSRKI